LEASRQRAGDTLVDLKAERAQLDGEHQRKRLKGDPNTLKLRRAWIFAIAVISAAGRRVAPFGPAPPSPIYRRLLPCTGVARFTPDRA
jgi:hypothetical protein